MKTETLEDLLIDELRDVLSAENQLIKTLPRLAKAAANPELKQGFEAHTEQSKQQVERLKEVFKVLGKSPRAKHCKGMEGLLTEATELLEEDMEPDVLDAALIGAAQKAEHYEIAAYGTLKTFSQQLGQQQAVDLLTQTLDEEKQQDQKLSQLAESHVNQDAG